MKRSFSAVLEAALVGGALAALAAGCDTPASTDTGVQADADPGCPGCPGADAGCPGCPGADAGCPGCPGADAGCPGCPGPDGGGMAAAVPSDPSMYAAFVAGDAFRTWRCDSAPVAPLADSPHGQNVICVNPTLDAARAGSGAWPVGSATVKIAFDGAGAETARFMSVRQSAAAGADGWYFFRAGGPSGPGTDMTVAGCVGCHSVGRDYVRRVPE